LEGANGCKIAAKAACSHYPKRWLTKISSVQNLRYLKTIRRFVYSIMKSLCWLLVGFYLLPLQGICQRPGFDISVRQISLPGSFNRDLLHVARDDEGFIWFTNNEGIWRFDGSDIKLIDNSRLKLSQNHNANSLFCYSNFLVLCLSNGEVHLYDKLTDICTIYQVQGSLTNLATAPGGTAFLFTTEGQAWTCTAKGILQKAIDLKQYKGWKKDMVLDRALIDEKGNIYLFLDHKVGLVLKDSIAWGGVVSKDIPQKSAEYALSGCVATSEFIAVQYVNDQVALYSKKTLAPIAYFSKQVSAACIVVNDELVMLPNSDTVRIPPAMLPFFYIKKGVFSEFSKVFDVIGGNGKPFLVGTTTGLFELAPQAAGGHNFYNQQKAVAFFSHKSVRCIYRVDDKLYIGTYSGLFVCSGDTIRAIPNGWAYTMRPESSHKLLVGIESGSGFGLLDCRTDSLIRLPKLAGDSDVYTTALYKEKDSWLTGDYHNLRRLTEKEGTLHLTTLSADPRLGTFRQISQMNGQIYVACRQGVYRMDEHDVLHKIYPQNDATLVYAMQGVTDGIWLGTHGLGLIKIDYYGKVLQQLSFNEGLASNFVYSLALMNNLLVAGTGAGVSLFDLGGSPFPLPINRDEKNNGFSDQECNHSAVYYDTLSGKIILGGVNGLIFVNGADYGRRPDGPGKHMILSYIKTGNHETNSAMADLFANSEPQVRLTPNDLNLVLKFASPNDPGQQEGLFRIKELSEKWQRIKLGQEVSLFALPPGKYTMQARLPFAVNENDWFSKTLVVEPAFYQTFLFRLLLLLIFLGIIYLIWRSKMKKLEEEQLLRATIARDLHDDIGSTLNSISVYTEIAKQQLHGGSEKTTALLEKMGMASRSMIDKMSDIVWAINPRNDDFEQVLQRMQFFAGELLSGKNILLHFHADEKSRKLKFKMQERKNIYLIYKEAINNAYKYSDAKNVSVDIGKNGNDVILTLTDDGKGFDKQEKANSGNGLANMENRAREIGATLGIEKSTDGGTRILLTLKITARH
jgi:signal transduction histidine kinase